MSVVQGYERGAFSMLPGARDDGPGVLVARVVAALRAAEGRLGWLDLPGLLAKKPLLLRTAPDELVGRIEALHEQLLGVLAQAEARRIINGGDGMTTYLTQPVLVAQHITSFRSCYRLVLGRWPANGVVAERVHSDPSGVSAVRQRLEGLVQRLGPQAAHRALTRQPSLMYNRLEVVDANLLALQQAMSLRRSDAAELAAAAPRLLTVRPEVFARTLQVLREELHCNDASLLRILRAFPHVFTSGATTLRARLRDLAHLLGCAQDAPALARALTQQPSLLGNSRKLLQQKLALLSELLGLEGERCGRLLLRYPGVLTLSADTLTQRVSGLAAVLGVDDAKVKELAARNPTILNYRPETVAAKLAALADIAGIEREQARALLGGSLHAVTASVGTLSARLARLRVLVAQNGEWAATVESLAASALRRAGGGAAQARDSVALWTVAVLKQAVKRTMLRMEFLLAQGLGEAASLHFVVYSTNATWGERFPGYSAWEARRLVELTRDPSDWGGAAGLGRFGVVAPSGGSGGASVVGAGGSGVYHEVGVDGAPQ